MGIVARFELGHGPLPQRREKLLAVGTTEQRVVRNHRPATGDRFALVAPDHQKCRQGAPCGERVDVQCLEASHDLGKVDRVRSGGRGSFRDELICTTTINNRQTVVIYTNTTLIKKRGIARLADHEYKTWLARNLTSGYGSYFEWQPPDKK